MRRRVIKPPTDSPWISIDGYEMDEISRKRREKEWEQLRRRELAFFKREARQQEQELKEKWRAEGRPKVWKKWLEDYRKDNPSGADFIPVNDDDWKGPPRKKWYFDTQGSQGNPVLVDQLQPEEYDSDDEVEVILAGPGQRGISNAYRGLTMGTPTPAILPSGPTSNGGNYFGDDDDDDDDWMNEALDSIDNEAITSSPPSITMGQPGPDARQEGESIYQYIYRTGFRKDPTDKRPVGRVGDPIWP